MSLRSVLLALLFLPVIPLQASVYEDYDQFTGMRHVETGAWGFKGENILDGGLSLSIIPARTTLPDKSQEYKLKLQWSGEELDLVGRSPILILLIDGKQFVLQASETPVQHLIDERIAEQGDIMERAEFITTSELIERIARSKSVKCALYTSRGRFERTFGRGNKKIFKEFVKKVIDKK